MNCIVIYNHSLEFVEIEADNELDLILQFAEWTGEKSDLFCIAIKGCETIEDMTKMFNRFCTHDEIVEIIEVGKTLYKDENY